MTMLLIHNSIFQFDVSGVLVQLERYEHDWRSEGTHGVHDLVETRHKGLWADFKRKCFSTLHPMFFLSVKVTSQRAMCKHTTTKA